MSQELLFTSGYININGSNDIKGKTFSCHYVPDGEDLKMRINNLSLSENSSINFKILLNNQYPSPSSDVSYQFITNASINETIQPIMKFNNEDEKITTSHYILQEIIVNRNKLNDYEIWSKIIKIPIPNEYSQGVDIMDIKRLENGNSFYDISYANYYTNVGGIQEDPLYSDDRKCVDISFSSQVTEDITDFETFIVNLYEQDGDLVDTSGNEDDPSSNTISKTASDFKIFNLRPDINYNIEVHPVVNSSNDYDYDFKFKDFFRLKEMHVYTDISMNSQTVKSKISQIKYKYLPEDEIYSSVNLDHGLELFEQSVTNNIYIHKFRITTPNIYKCFQIVLNDSTNITNIKLIGDKNTRL
jgi:hypothetical protein